MPKIEDLQQYQQQLISIANEQAVAAEQGRRIELVDPDSAGQKAAEFADLFEPDDTSPSPEDAQQSDVESQEDYSQQLFDSVQPEDEESSQDEFTGEDILAGFNFDDEDPFSSADSSGVPNDLVDEPDEPDEPEEPDDFDLEEFSADLFDEPDADEAADSELESVPDDAAAADVDDVLDIEGVPDDAAAADIEDVSDIDLEPELETGSFDDEFATPDFDSIDDIMSDSGDESSDNLPDFGDSSDAAGDDLDTLGELGSVDAGELDDFEDDLDADEFSLGDFGAEFGVLEEEQSDIAGVESYYQGDAEDAELLDEAESDTLELTDQEFRLLRSNLQQLPLNLKIHVEDIIGDSQGSYDQQRALLDQIIKGENPKLIAGSAGRIIGKKIVIPKGYEKHTGLEFEKKQDTLAYQLRYVVWPVVRTAVVILALLTAFSLSVYNFVFSPLYAGHLYRQGYEQLQDTVYDEAERYFGRAREFHHSERWYIRYGQGYREQREFLRARSRFDETLERWPRSKQGRLAYGSMESQDLVNFQRAEDLLRGYYPLEASAPYDYDIELERGDNFLRWGEMEYERYEDARRSYAGLLEQEGGQDLLLFRMLRYFIRTDNMEEVNRLRTYFDVGEPTIDGEAYAELGGYLIDKYLHNSAQHSLDGVNTILLSALDASPRHPPAYYHLARQYRISNDRSPENRALDTAITLFEQERPLGRFNMEMLIDAVIRRGENYARQEQDLDALRYLDRARSEYENAVSRALIHPQEHFGRLYNRIGDIYYYRGSEYSDALQMYQTAKRNHYTPRQQDYKMGVIHYRANRYDEALESFSDARTAFGENRNLEYAFGNTLFRRRSYSAAVGYYSRLLNRLQQERRGIPNLYVDENPRHRALMEYLRRTHNNLGVALLRESQVSGNRENWTRGVANLTESAEISENYFRDPETGTRAEIINLGYLNVRSSLVPSDSFDLEIFDSLLQDFEDDQFRTY